MNLINKIIGNRNFFKYLFKKDKDYYFNNKLNILNNIYAKNTYYWLNVLINNNSDKFLKKHFNLSNEI